MIRTLLLALALFQVAATTNPQSETAFSRYRRQIPVTVPGQTCAILDAATFAHAEPFLKDLRLYASGGPAGPHEIPYVVTLSEAQQSENEPARILNLGTRGRSIDFDLQMPDRPYTEVVLDLAAQDFLATASVRGISAPGALSGTALGDFNLFDLTSQHLSRSTVLHLQESTFPYLHVTLSASSATPGHRFELTPQMVHAATVPPSREAQTLFTVAAETADLETHGRQTVARFHLAQRIPIERVSVALAPDFHANFSRDIVVRSHTEGSPENSGDTVAGTIQRVRLASGTREISDQQLSVPATLGANLQSPAEVEVAVNNGDDPPLPISGISLEMRRRALCFQAAEGQQFTLRYGDPKLEAPVYDLARTYTPSARSALVTLGPEELNPAWQPRPDDRPYTERHPHLLWIALLCVVCILALVAFRSSHPRSHHHQP